VLSIDVSSDGRWLVSTSKDKTVRWWDLSTPSSASLFSMTDIPCVAIGEGHAESVGTVAFCKAKTVQQTNRLFVVSGARDRTIKLWDCSILLKHTPSATASSPFNLSPVVSRLGHSKDINCLDISPNDKLVASGSEDKSIRLWSSDDLSPQAVLQGHKRGVWCVRFSPVDKVLASTSGDKTIKLWSMTDYTCLKTLEGHSASVKQLQFLHAGMQLLTSADDGMVKLWTIKTAECVNTFAEEHSGKIWGLVLTQDQQKMITGGGDSILNIWTDVSEQDKNQDEEAQEQNILKEQQLNNWLRQKKYDKAVQLALDLEQPRKLCDIFTKMCLEEEKTKQQEVKEQVDQAVQQFDRYSTHSDTSWRNMHFYIIKRLSQHFSFFFTWLPVRSFNSCSN